MATPLADHAAYWQSVRDERDRLAICIRTICDRLKGCLCIHCQDDPVRLAEEALEGFTRLRAENERLRKQLAASRFGSDKSPDFI